MTIEINGEVVTSTSTVGSVESALDRAELRLERANKNINTRKEDTLLYASLLEDQGKPVSEDELQQIADKRDAPRVSAEYDVNQLRAIANLLGINRGGIGYPVDVPVISRDSVQI